MQPDNDLCIFPYFPSSSVSSTNSPDMIPPTVQAQTYTPKRSDPGKYSCFKQDTYIINMATD